ncbi:MAG: ABC transporter ATP-binding protein [Proteobacteria bacterium]|nr:ABC transporter ATP-binding protein [Pseudomonadota bacterium]
MPQFELSPKKLFRPFSNDLSNPNIKYFLKKILSEEKNFYSTTIIYGIAIAILSLALPISVQLLINSVAFTAMFQPILILGCVLLLLLTFSSILNALQIYVAEIFQRRFFARMTADITLSVINAKHENFEQANQTEFINRFFDVINIQKTMPKVLIKTFTLILQTFAGLILVAFYHPLLLVFSLIIIVNILIIWLVFSKNGFITKFYASRRKYDMASWLEDIARNNILFKSEIGQKYAVFKTDFLTEQYFFERKKHFKYVFLQICLMLTLYTIASASLLIIGGYLVIKGQLSIGQLVASELVLSTTLYGISELGRDFEIFYDLASSAEKLSQFYNIDQEDSAREKIDNHKIRIKFNNVVDNYFGRDFNFNFNLESQKNYLISTTNLTYQKILLELIYGLRKPIRGSLQFNDIDIENIDLANLRSHIAIIDNSSFIEGTIVEYLTFNDKNINKKFLNEILFITGLDKVVARFKDGLNQKINPSGFPLSESEKILLKIARGLLQHPKIIIITEVLDMLGLASRREILKFLTKNHEAMVLYFSDRRDDMLDFNEYLFIDENKIHHFKSISELDKFEQKNG